MKKSSKRFVLSSEALNSKGFRVKTSGIDLSQYEKNPQLLWMHTRPKGSKDDLLPLGNGADLAVEGDKLYFTPVFDDTDDFAMKIYQKVENGTLRMCSAGLGKPWQFEEINGEIWLTKCRLVEASICDAGANDEALASEVELYDENDQRINLSASSIKNLFPKSNYKSDMKKIELNADRALSLVELAEGSTADQFLQKVESVIALTKTQAEEIAKLTKAKETVEQAKIKAEAEVAKLKKEAERAELVQLVNDAEAKGKITKGDRVKFLGDEEKEIEGLSLDQAKVVLDLLPENKTVEAQLTKNSGDSLLKMAREKGWKELEADGLLIELRAKHLDVFKEKYKEYFKKDYEE